MRFSTRAAGVACVTMLSVSAFARIEIHEGWDYFVTMPGTYVGFDPGTILPAGFFGTYNGMPSDPLMLPTVMPLQGRSLGAYPPTIDPGFFVGPLSEAERLAAHNVMDPRLLGRTDHDTIVRRDATAVLNNVGDSATIPIQIVNLSLESAAPIPISFGNATFVSFFDVWTELDFSMPSPMGSMDITLTNPTGGTITSTLPVNHRTTFRAFDPLVVPGEAFMVGQFVLHGEGVWSTTPAPGSLLVVGLAGIVSSRRRR